MQDISGTDTIAQRTPNTPDCFTASLVLFLSFDFQQFY
jgi:hypothetical protein